MPAPVPRVPVPGGFHGRRGLPLRAPSRHLAAAMRRSRDIESLLRESRANHLGKRLFPWVYWHALLPGRPLPGLGPAMPLAGKELAKAA